MSDLTHERLDELERLPAWTPIDPATVRALVAWCRERDEALRIMREAQDSSLENAHGKFLAEAENTILREERDRMLAFMHEHKIYEEDSAIQVIRLGDLLNGVVNAIRGEPEPLNRHSYHDAPELARKLAAENAALRERDEAAERKLAEINARIRVICPCRCHEDYTDRQMISPDCPWHNYGIELVSAPVGGTGGGG